MTIAYLTAGAAGMYCGSCMHDNTLARGLTQLGVDIQLIPTYTPIRTDEENVSIDRVFFGGINVFLQQKIPLLRYLPTFIDGYLDQPWLIRRLAAGAVNTSPRELGSLTLSMLKGTHGRQRKEIGRLCRYLAKSVQPKLIVLSNMLIGGCIPEIKRQLGVPVLVTLQGDDIFLEVLAEPYKSRVFDEIRRLVRDVDGFITHSRFYADFMRDYFSIPADRFHILPLGIDTDGYDDPQDSTVEVDRPPTVGYLARLAPEKGLHFLVDAFIQLRRMPGAEQAQLRIAGWLGKNHQDYADKQFQRLIDAGLGDAFECLGTVDRAAKIRFLRQLDVLSVPTEYRDPKGLYVLEALAAGVPVVQPDHGAFPELIAATGGGRLVPPNNAAQLATALHELLTDAESRRAMSDAGRAATLDRFNLPATSSAARDLFQRFMA